MPAAGQVVVQLARPGYEPSLLLMPLNKEIKKSPMVLKSDRIRVSVEVEGGKRSIVNRVEGALAKQPNLEAAPFDALKILATEINNKSVPLNTAQAVEALRSKLRRARTDYQIQIEISGGE